MLVYFILFFWLQKLFIVNGIYFIDEYRRWETYSPIDEQKSLINANSGKGSRFRIAIKIKQYTA